MRPYTIRWLFIVALTLSFLPGLLTRAQADGPIQVDLKLTPVGEKNNFAGSTATAIVDKKSGWAVITLKLPAGYTIPEKTIFEGWITDPGGIEGVEASSAGVGDLKFGPRYANGTLARLVDAVPYWLSLGILVDDRSGTNTLTTAIRWPNYNFGPYDAVTISIETDGNETPWDPRPGSTIWRGVIAEGTPATDIPDMDALVGVFPDLGTAQGVRLNITKLGEAAGLSGATGRAFVLVEAAAAEVEVALPDGVTLPEGAVLEAFVADGGKLGNFGPSNVLPGDNQLGPTFNNLYYGSIAEAVPFATSLGVLKQGDNGIYRLQIHWQKYAFRVYDIVMITLESDGNTAPWNPRPGSPVFVGAITSNTDPAALLAMPAEDEMIGGK